MKSKTFTLLKAVTAIKRFTAMLNDDLVSLSAAQTSFFIITSAIPFISVLFALIGALLPSTPQIIDLNLPFSSTFGDLLLYVAEEIQTAPSVPLLSISAVTTLWTASRGVAAARSGLARICDADISSNYLIHRISSLFSTLIMMLLLTATSLFFIFGDFLSDLFGGIFSKLASWISAPLFIALLTVLFTIMYFSIGRRSKMFPKNIFIHVPGAIFSALGWVIFSLFYSLYLKFFPHASAVYGGLGAICLIMLWLYFCMTIFFLGAEVNKIFYLYFHGKQREKSTTENA